MPKTKSSSVQEGRKPGQLNPDPIDAITINDVSIGVEYSYPDKIIMTMQDGKKYQLTIKELK